NCDRLSVTSISGTFTDESSANVDTKIQTSFTKLSDNFKDNTICIDTTAPTLTGVTISDITDSSGTPHIKNSKYYLNDGDTVTMNITFSEPVVPVGTSEVLLNSSEKATCISSGLNSTHTYRYTVRNGNTSSLGLSNTVVSEVQDEAGNRLTAAYTQADMQFAGKTIVVDTTLPAEPVFTIVDQSSQTVANNSSKSEKLSLTISGEAEADIQYSVNGGASYQSYTGAVTLGVDKAQTLYKITAKQTDPAGNEKTTPSVFTVTVDLRVVGLKGVTTTKMGGTYKSGEKIPLTIEFYKAVTVSNGKLTLDNGAEVSFSVSGKTSVTVTYTVGAAASFSTDRLYAKSIRGTFKDTATNSLVTSFDNVSGSITSGVVDGTIAAAAENLPTDSANKIIIDTVAPTMQSAALTDISDKGHLDGSYYLNAGDTVTMTLTMNDAVIVRGSSSLTLSNGGSAVYSAISDDKMTLTYIYTVSSSDTNAASLSIPAGAYPNNVTDMAGNELSSGLAAAQVLRYGGKDLIIDTQCAAPTVTVTNADGSVISGSGTNRQIKITVTGAADKASSEYSLDAGASYTPYTAAVTVGEAGELKTYKILARQTDKAGNLSPASASQTITVDMRTMGLKSISTTKMGGVYKAGEIIPIVLEFNKATTVTDGSLTLNNGASVSFSCTNKTSCTANYQIGPSDTSIAALQVTNFTGTIKDPSVGNAFVTSFDNVGGSVSNGAVSGAIGSITNLPSSGVNAVGVDTIAPTIAASGIAFSASTGVVSGGKYYCKAGTTVTISVKMSETVTVTGSSQLTLSNGAKASYDHISDDKKTLYYVYTIASGDTNTSALSVAKNIFPNNVTDQAGNLLAAGLGSASAISNVIIDTQCGQPAMTLSPNIADKGSTDKTVTLTFSNNDESNAVIRYSTDGGSSYSQYSTAVTLGISDQKNTYQIMAYQTDIAGNQSSSTTMRTLTVDMRVLKLSSITTTKVAGTYKAGEVIPLTLTFSKNVTVTGGKLTLNTNKTVSFACTNASTVTINYTVQAGDNVNALKATGITAGTIQDVDAGNVTADNAVIYSKMLSRDNIPTNIKLDTTAPNVTGYTVTST
ncbi:MAG: hypothetical protein IKP67_06620, partial [Spirochaetales bacterium]|nr:hypothetical protein [Spirochaetales bacterium]